MKKIVNIVKSRFINGESLPEWYEERLKICSQCPLNSKNIENKDKSSKQKAWEFIAGANCTDPSCGCTITQKAKIDTEFCPKSKWLALADKRASKLDIVVETKKADVYFDSSNIKYVADYGEIPYEFESEINFIIKDKDLKTLRTQSGCGCTVAKAEYKRDGVNISIKYDTKRIGRFDKNVKIIYTRQDDVQKTTNINIKGTVKKER